jgi:hypothetical protein
MPIMIKSLDSGLGISFTGNGIVTGEELINATRKIFSSEESIRKSRYGLLDFSKIELLNATSAELKIVTDMDTRAAQINPDLIITIVTEESSAYGISLIWKAYMDETNWESKIFRSLPEAEAWMKKRVKEKFGIDITIS